MKRLGILIVSCLIACSLVLAQDKPVVAPKPVEAAKVETPTMSELDALKLDKIVLSMENAQLQIVQLQTTLKEMQGQAQSFVQSLQKPGFNLTRNDKGAWVYMVAEKSAELKKQ